MYPWFILAILLSINVGSNCQTELYTLYLTYNEEIDAKLTQETFKTITTPTCNKIVRNKIQFESIPPNFLKKPLNFYEEQSSKMNASKVSGIFGAKDYFLSSLYYPTTILGVCNDVKDIYVSTIDVDLVAYVQAAVTLLLQMQTWQSNNGSTKKELTIMALPKYYTRIENPFAITELLDNTHDLTTPIMVFWFRNEGDVKVFVNLIALHDATNVVALLPEKFLNQLVNLAYQKDLFRWDQRWILMAANGSMPVLTGDGPHVDSLNVTVIHLGSPLETQSEQEASTSVKLATDAAHIANNFLMKSCCPGENQESTTKFRTGQFNLTNTNAPRVNTSFLVYRNLGQTRTYVGYIDVTSKKAVLNVTPIGNFNATDEEILKILKSRPLRIAAQLGTPFVMLSPGVELPSQLPADMAPGQLTGFSTELIESILKMANVNYTFRLFPRRYEKKSKLAPFLDSVLAGESDIAVGELSVIDELRNEFDFLQNYLFFTYSVLEKPFATTPKPYLWLFFEPLHYGVWLLVLFFTIATALVLATLNYFSPNSGNFGFMESIFITFGCLFQGLTYAIPNRWSSRMMHVVWWIFVLLFLVIYGANFAALRMVHGITNDLNGFKALLRNPSIPFGIQQGSVAEFQLSLSSDTEIMEVLYLSYQLHNKWWNTTMEEKVAAAVKGEFRFIGDDFTLQYFAQQNCLEVSGEYSSEEYAMYLRKGTVYTDYLNELIYKMDIDRLLEPLIDKYTVQSDSACDAIPGSEKGTLETAVLLYEVGGIFVLSAIGLGIAIILAILECIFAKKQEPLAGLILKGKAENRVRNFC